MKSKGNVISSVGWNSEYCRENRTGFILIGTTNGQLYECNIDVPPHEDKNRPANVLYWKLVNF